MVSAKCLIQSGLVCGFVGSVLLFYSTKVGVMMPDGRMRFEGLDDLAPVEENKSKVRSSHWRNKWFTPIGWLLIIAAFSLQFISTII